jgi:FixJ family two-component response regulator
VTSNLIVAVVDDDASILSAMSSLVRSLGFAALTFASAEALLRHSDIRAVNFVISDVQMPGGLGGFDLLDVFRGRHVEIPFVFMTGLAAETVRAQALEQGVLAFMRKPIDACDLAELLETNLRRDGSSACPRT